VTVCRWCYQPITTYGLDTGRDPGGRTMWTHEIEDGCYETKCRGVTGIVFTAEPQENP
jgi:hypothetical protein